MRRRHLAPLCLLASLASAHGLAPQTLGVAQSPFHDGGLVAPTTFGLLLTSDRCTWRWVCTDHVGLGDREQPAWFVTPSGTIAAGALSGLYLSRDRGCSFARQSFFDATGAADLIVSGDTLFVTTSKYGVTNGLARSTDDGRTFEWAGLRGDRQFFNAVRVAPSRPQRVYVSAWYFDPRLVRLAVSDDRGATFTTVDLPGSLAAGTVFTVHAVDQRDPDLVFASLTDDTVTPERTSLLRSADGGRTVAVVLEAAGRVNGLFQRDGNWWVAVGDRVFSSPDGRAFTVEPSPTQRACVGEGGGETIVCGRPGGEDGFALATLGPAGTTPLLKWTQLAGPIDCPTGAPAASACAVTWPVERAELGLPADHVAACDGVGRPPEPARACGCHTGQAGVLALAVVFFLRRSGRVESARHR